MRCSHAWGAVTETAAALAEATLRWRGGDAGAVRRLRRLAAALAPEFEGEGDVSSEEGGLQEEREGGSQEQAEENSAWEGMDVYEAVVANGLQNGVHSGSSESTSSGSEMDESDMGEEGKAASDSDAASTVSSSSESGEEGTSSEEGSDRGKSSKQKGATMSSSEEDSDTVEHSHGTDGGEGNQGEPSGSGDDESTDAGADVDADAHADAAAANTDFDAADLQQPAVAEVCVVHNPRASVAADAMLACLLPCPAFLAAASGKLAKHSTGSVQTGEDSSAASKKDPSCPGAPALPPFIQQMPLPLSSLTQLMALQPPPSPMPFLHNIAVSAAPNHAAPLQPASNESALDLRLEHLVLLETLLGLRRAYTALQSGTGADIASSDDGSGAFVQNVLH